MLLRFYHCTQIVKLPLCRKFVAHHKLLLTLTTKVCAKRQAKLTALRPLVPLLVLAHTRHIHEVLVDCKELHDVWVFKNGLYLFVIGSDELVGIVGLIHRLGCVERNLLLLILHLLLLVDLVDEGEL